MDTGKLIELVDEAKIEDKVLTADEEIVEAAEERGLKVGSKAVEGALSAHQDDWGDLTPSQIAEAKYKFRQKRMFSR